MRALLALLVMFAMEAASAQAYPNHPIRLVVPFAPGGSADLVGRLLGAQLGEALGQQVVVENRPGASGMIGNEFVAKSAPDGYTLTVGTLGPFAVNATLFDKQPYDHIRDFAPITLTGISSHVLVAHPSVPVENLNDVIALAKARPGQLAFASSGRGNATHLTFELFKARAGIDIVHAPYKGGGPAMADLVGGQGILAPAKTPQDTIMKLNAEIARILALPEVKSKLASAGFDAKSSTPQWFGEFIQAETVKWAKLLKQSGIRAE